MNAVFEKLHLKEHLKDEMRIVALNSPNEFKPNIEELKKDGIIVDPERMPSTIYEYALIFVKTAEEIGVTASMTAKSLVWKGPTMVIASPKSTSEKHPTDITSPDAWEVMDQIGFKEIDAVDIDEDWEAHCFTRK